jgi:hypothetical protein
LGRKDLAKRSLIRMEKAATAAAFEAMSLTEWSKDFYNKLLLGEEGLFVADDPISSSEGREAALETVGMCGRLLVLQPQMVTLPPE